MNKTLKLQYKNLNSAISLSLSEENIVLCSMFKRWVRRVLIEIHKHLLFVFVRGDVQMFVHVSTVMISVLRDVYLFILLLDLSC